MAYANEPAYLITFRYGYFVMFVVADNDITIAGRARAATRRFHWLQANAICIISNSARYAAFARVLQVL